MSPLGGMIKMGLKAESILERALDMGRLGKGRGRRVSVSDSFLAWFKLKMVAHEGRESSAQDDSLRKPTFSVLINGMCSVWV